MDIPMMLKQARRSAGLSQRVLAERAGVNRNALSRYEHGTRVPTMATLRAVLAAAGLQIRAELEPLDADVRAAIATAAETPMVDRTGVFAWGQVNRIAEVHHRVEGLAAASVLGAPVPVETFEVAFADDDATFEWLSEEMMSWVAKVRAPEWDLFGVLRHAAPALRERLTAECPDGQFWLRSGFTDAKVRLAPPEVVARHVRVDTPHGLIPVQPLHEIDSGDPAVARVLRVLRETL